MPHQCVRCNNFYEDGSEAILKGCECGGKLFFYIKKDKLEKAKRQIKDLDLSDEDKEQIEEDVFDLIGNKMDKSSPVILDLEAIRVLKPGQYELDLVNLFNGEPLIFRVEEGKYIIDVVESFNQLKKKKR